MMSWLSWDPPWGNRQSGRLPDAADGATLQQCTEESAYRLLAFRPGELYIMLFVLRALFGIIKTVQTMCRHASPVVTLGIYTHAVDSKKRKAQSKVVEMILPKNRPERTAEVTA